MKDRKKILFVCNSSWGLYKFRINLIRALVKAGFDIVVLAPMDRHTEHLTNEKGITFIPLKWMRPTSFSILSDLMLYREMLRQYRKIAPDLIFHYTIKPNIYGSLAARRLGLPSVSVITGLGYTFLNDGWLRKAVGAFYRLALKQVKEIWFLNPDDRSYFIKQSIVSPANSLVIPGEGVDEQYFQSGTNYEIRPKLRFLLLGRIIKEKGIFEYVEAARQLLAKGYQAEFLLAGFYDHANPASVPHKQFFEWMSSGVITYLGASDDVRPFIDQADCIVLPSYSEGLPLTLLEGGSMSRPLIASDVAGCHDIVFPGFNGFLCQARSADSLAGALSNFYHLSPSERLEMGRNARKIVHERFTQTIVIRQYFEGLSRLLDISVQSFRQQQTPKSTP